MLRTFLVTCWILSGQYLNTLQCERIMTNTRKKQKKSTFFQGQNKADNFISDKIWLEGSIHTSFFITLVTQHQPTPRRSSGPNWCWRDGGVFSLLRSKTHRQPLNPSLLLVLTMEKRWCPWWLPSHGHQLKAGWIPTHFVTQASHPINEQELSLNECPGARETGSYAIKLFFTFSVSAQKSNPFAVGAAQTWFGYKMLGALSKWHWRKWGSQSCSVWRKTISSRERSTGSKSVLCRSEPSEQEQGL